MYKKIICSSVLISMDYVLEIEQRLFKPLADNHQALYFVYYFFDKTCDIEIVIIILFAKVANFRKIYKYKIKY